MPDTVWYVGIGSMMNLTALRLRGIHPVQSVWCEIQDHRRIFYGPATLVDDVGEVVHAVAHEITAHELEMLEAREPPSKRVRLLLKAGPNVGAVVEASASVDTRTCLHGISAQDGQMGEPIRQESSGASARVAGVVAAGTLVSFTNGVPFEVSGEVLISGVVAGVPSAISTQPPQEMLPTARYIALMVEGAESVKMDPAVIASIASTPCSPRKSSSELARLPVREEARRIFTEEELRSGHYVVFRGMVLAPEGEVWRQWTPRLFNGIPDVAFDLSRQIYDPLYGLPPASPHEPWDGWAFIEDILTYGPWLRAYGHVGWIASPTSKL